MFGVYAKEGAGGLTATDKVRRKRRGVRDLATVDAMKATAGLERNVESKANALAAQARSAEVLVQKREWGPNPTP